MKKISLLITLLTAFLLPPCVSAESAKMAFENTLHSFDVIEEQGGKVSHDFVFTNEGDGALVIYDVVTNCGCTVAHFPQEPIMPGEQGVIKVTFDPKGNPGEFAKEIIVRSNAQKKKMRLRIKGAVIPHYE